MVVHAPNSNIVIVQLVSLEQGVKQTICVLLVLVSMEEFAMPQELHTLAHALQDILETTARAVLACVILLLV